MGHEGRREAGVEETLETGLGENPEGQQLGWEELVSREESLVRQHVAEKQESALQSLGGQ